MKTFLQMALKMAYRAMSTKAISSTSTLAKTISPSQSPLLLQRHRRQLHLAKRMEAFQGPPAFQLYQSSSQWGLKDFNGRIKNEKSDRAEQFDRSENISISTSTTTATTSSHSTTAISQTTQSTQSTQTSLGDTFPFLTADELKIFDSSIYE